MSDPAIQKPNVWKMRFTILISLTLLWFVWKADVFWHYYQFRQICAAEGGMQIMQPLKKNVGWEMQPPSSLQQALILTKAIPNMGFVRIKRGAYDPMPELGEGGLLDVKYVSGETYSAKVGFKPADLNAPIVYQYFSDVNREPDARISRFVQEVREVSTKKVLLRNTQLEFHWRSIAIWHWFGPSGRTGCPLVHPDVSNTSLIQTTAFAN